MISSDDRYSAEAVVDVGVTVVQMSMKADIPDEMIRELLLEGFTQEGVTVGPEAQERIAYVAATAIHRLAVLIAAFESLEGLPPRPEGVDAQSWGITNE